MLLEQYCDCEFTRMQSLKHIYELERPSLNVLFVDIKRFFLSVMVPCSCMNSFFKRLNLFFMTILLLVAKIDYFKRLL